MTLTAINSENTEGTEKGRRSREKKLTDKIKLFKQSLEMFVKSCGSR